MTRSALIIRYARTARTAPYSRRATEIWLELRNATTAALRGEKRIVRVKAGTRKKQ